MKILIFTGAGCSAELGIPTMRSMVELFRDHLDERALSPGLLEKLDERLESHEYDMEYLVDELDLLAEAEEVQEKWGGTNKTDLDEDIPVVRAEAEWFIQHVCERVQLRDASTLWTPILRKKSNHEFVIATTNYDRAIELAASQLSIKINDGFPEFEENEWVSWNGFSGREGIVLLKLHGSTDWYLSEEDDTVWKLRHPMPLFGSINLRVQGQSQVDLVNAAVLPSREKKIRRPPYPELTAEFQKQAPSVDLALFLGSSLRDPNIRSVYHICLNQCPTFLVNTSGKYIPQVQTNDAYIIEQSASRFLLSTLPTALNRDGEDVTEFLKQQTNISRSEGILQEVVSAIHRTGTRQERLEAIDNLASLQVPLGREQIMPILEDDDPAIQKYALGLLQESPDQEFLIDKSAELAEQNPDSEFTSEYELLMELLD